MSKFNFEEANSKNVCSGEDGFLFVHQSENGENCIEINSDNLIDCVKTHLAPLLGENFNALKLWMRLITPKGKFVFNMEDARIFILKLFIPFFDTEEKEKFGKIIDEWYEQIIAIKDGNYVWKLLEARANEEVFDVTSYEGDTNFDKYSHFLLERFDDLLGSEEREKNQFYNRMVELYNELLPNFTKEFKALKDSKSDWFMIFKPFIDVATLGILTELIDNTNIVEKITSFITTNMGLFMNFKDKFKKQNSSGVSNLSDFFKSYSEKVDDEAKEFADKLSKFKETDKEFYDKLLESLKKATQMSEEEMKKEWDILAEWAKVARSGATATKEEKKETEKDWKSELKEKVSKQIDTILKRADTMSPEELTDAFTGCNNAVRDIISLRKLMKDFKRDVDSLKG